MTPNRLRIVTAAMFLVVWLAAGAAFAGPPFITDDPEPVEYKHWEIYAFSIYNHFSDGDFAQAPAIEVNYGVLPDLQLHVISAAAVSQTSGGSAHFGYGDTELGVKYRFIHETDWIPQVGTFPLVEVPTGDASRGLGNGDTQVFLPVWLQKSFGPDKEWTTFGGGGYWFNPGRDHRNFTRFGWELQREFNDHITLGVEVYHETAATRDQSGHTAFNLGVYYNLDEHNHLLVSVGRDIDGPSRFTSYVGYQLTF